MKTFVQYLADTVGFNLTPLSLNQFPLIFKTNKSASSYLTKMLAVMNPAIEARSINRSNLNKIKEQYRSLVGAAGQHIVDNNPSVKMPEQDQYKYDQLRRYVQEPHFHMHLDAYVTHSVESGPDSPIRTVWLEISKEYKVLADTITELEKVVERKPTKQEQGILDTYSAPASTKDAQELVRRVLTEMTNDVKQQYIEQTEQPWLESLEQFFAKEHTDQLRHLKLDPDSVQALKDKNTTARTDHIQRTGQSWGFKEQSRTPTFLETSLLPVAADQVKVGGSFTTNGLPKWTPKSNWQHFIHLKAVNQANSMQQAFVEKNVRKLSSIVEVKGNIQGDPKVLNVQCRSGIIEGNIQFIFKDGSKFIVRNKIVSKDYEARGGQWATMYQFPTTFHDAKLPNGSVMPGQPSEQDMNEIFGKATV